MPNLANQLVKKRKAKVPSKALAQQRVVEVAALLLTLKSRRFIEDELTTKYHIQRRSCDKIITQAYAYIQDNYKTDRESVVTKHIEFYYDLAMQWKDIDPRTALKALEQVEKLLKMHQDQPLVAIQNNFNMENVTNDVLIKKIEELKAIKKDA